MKPSPTTAAEVAELLSCAAVKGECIGELNLSALSRILEHHPEDMTVTVEAGCTLASLQAALAKRGQWLPVDPPFPEQTTVGSLITGNLNGPRRFGYGTIRDWLIGIRVALPDGSLIRSGGKVVKNVAGYDLMKLFVGSHETLGVVIEATFKLRPLPEQERFIERAFDSPEAAAASIEAILDSDLCPMVLDLYRLNGNQLTLVIGFAGTGDEVKWQLEQAAALGFTSGTTLDYNCQFFTQTPGAAVRSVLPSKLTEVISTVHGSFVARAGNGVIYHAGPAYKAPLRSLAIMERLKNCFDPKQTLPPLPFQQ